MKRTIQIALLLGACMGSWLSPRPVFAQACKDDEAMALEDKKSLVEFVDMVKKESQGEFQKAFHQKSGLNKLTFSQSAVNGLLSCLDKAAQDTMATKEEVDAYKAKRETFAKLKAKIDQERKSLKDASDAKEAKALIEKFDWPN